MEGESNYLDYDRVNIHRQVIGNCAAAVRDRFTDCYRRGDRDGMLKAKAEFLELCDSLTSVLSTRREFSLQDWIDDARRWGITEEQKDYYEMNARTLISVWGDSFHLCDYANRDWDGLVDTYYKPRWEMFFDAVIAACDRGEEFLDSRSTGYVGYTAGGTSPDVTGPALDYDNDIWDFECRWAQVKE